MERSLVRCNRQRRYCCSVSLIITRCYTVLHARNFTTVSSLPETTNQIRIPSRRLLSIFAHITDIGILRWTIKLHVAPHWHLLTKLLERWRGSDRSFGSLLLTNMYMLFLDEKENYVLARSQPIIDVAPNVSLTLSGDGFATLGYHDSRISVWNQI